MRYKQGKKRATGSVLTELQLLISRHLEFKHVYLWPQSQMVFIVNVVGMG